MSNCRWALLALLSTACITQADRDAAKDRDGDGYRAFQAGGDDCDDADPAVNPGVVETCGNGIDDDCDSVVDDDGFGAGTWYRDADGDDYGVGPPLTACEAPQGYTDRDGDCDDGVGTTHPEATETWYDGVDADCDRADDYDQDGDGFRAAGEITGGDDCDDTTELVAPDLAEVCGNHIDDDCDGTANACGWATEVPGTVRARTLTLAAEAPRVAVGDTNGDGAADVLAFLPSTGDLRVYLGPWTSSLLPAAADVVLTLATPVSGHPYAALMDQDLSGDGRADLVVGAWSPGVRGRVDVFKDVDPTVDATLAQGDAFISYQGPADGTSATAGFGRSLWSHGRLSSDTRGTVSSSYQVGANLTCFVFRNAPTSGVADVVATSRILDCEGMVSEQVRTGSGTARLLSRAGFVYSLIDPTLASPIDASAQPTAALFATSTNADIPTILPDLTGDGTTEVLALLRQASPPRVVIPLGPTSATLNPSSLRFTPDGTTVFDAEAAAVGDFDGDGAQDVALLFETTAGNPAGAGAIGVRFGPFGSDAYVVDLSNMQATLTLDPAHRAETLLAADVDGDGYDDLVVAGAGFVQVLHGKGL